MSANRARGARWLGGMAASCALALTGGHAIAAEARVAVAANFAAPAKALAVRFEAETGHRVVVSVGSTGKFASQIAAGAPFDVFLAADDATPRRLVAQGLAVAGTQATYAVGRLVLWSRDPARVDADGRVLGRRDWQRLAIANPRLAPYGAAAMQVLSARGLADAVAPRLVTGDSVAQAWQFVATGNAEIGFVALAQVREGEGSAWRVPASLHDPIRQDAVLLARGRDKPAALAWLRFLRGAEARAMIAGFGYETAPP